MTTRERKAVAAAAIVVLAFVLLQFLLLPLWDESQRLQNGIASQKRQIAAMQELQRHLAPGAQQKQAAQLGRRKKDFSLFAFLEEAAAASRIKPHVQAMQPVEAAETAAGLSTVELQLKAVGLAQLGRFVDLVDAPDNLVAVERMVIQGSGKQGEPLDVSLRVQAVAGPGGEKRP